MRPAYTVPLRMGNPVYHPASRRSTFGSPARLAQNTDDVKKAKTQVAGVGLVALALAAGGTWIGVRTGLRESGLLSVTGWAVGVASALTALTSVGVLAALPFMPNAVATPASPAQLQP